MQINAVKEIKAICSISGSNRFKQKIFRLLWIFDEVVQFSNKKI